MVRPRAVITAVNMQVVSYSIVGNLSSLDSRINKVAISANDETEADFGTWTSPFVGNKYSKGTK